MSWDGSTNADNSGFNHLGQPWSGRVYLTLKNASSGSIPYCDRAQSICSIHFWSLWPSVPGPRNDWLIAQGISALPLRRDDSDSPRQRHGYVPAGSNSGEGSSIRGLVDSCRARACPERGSQSPSNFHCLFPLRQLTDERLGVGVAHANVRSYLWYVFIAEEFFGMHDYGIGGKSLQYHLLRFGDDGSPVDSR